MTRLTFNPSVLIGMGAVLLWAAAGSLHAQERTTIEADWSGEDDQAWAEQWRITGPSEVTIQDGEGEVRLDEEERGTQVTIAAFDPGEHDPNVVDSEQSVTLRLGRGAVDMVAGLFARRTEDSPDTYYVARLTRDENATLEIVRMAQGERESVIASAEEVVPIEENARLKFVVEQQDEAATRLAAKAWPADGDEPEEFQVEASDNFQALQEVSGQVGVTATTRARGRNWRFIDYEVSAAFGERTEEPEPVVAAEVAEPEANGEAEAQELDEIEEPEAMATDEEAAQADEAEEPEQ